MMYLVSDNAWKKTLNKKFESLYEYYCNGSNCDLYLLSENNKTFSVHASVLAASIPKIRNLIEAPSLTVMSKEHPFRVAGVNSRELQLIIQYAYLHRCDLQDCPPEAALELLKAASHLNIEGLKSLCKNALFKSLDINYAIKLLGENGKSADSILARESSELFLLRHLVTAGRDSAIVDLKPEVMMAILRDDRLHAPFEEMGLEAAMWWVEHDPAARRRLVPELLQSLRLGYLAPNTLDKLRQHPLVEGDARALAVLDSAGEALRSFSGAVCAELLKQRLPPVLRPRLPHAVLLTTGGWDETGPCKNTLAFDHLTERWIEVPDFDLELRRAYFGLELLENKLYVVGGFDRNHHLNTCHTLDLGTHIWENAEEMDHQRCFPVTAELKGQIHVVGGRSKDGVRLRTAEKFDPVTNTWSKLPSMMSTRSDAGGAVLHDKLYVVGGFDGSRQLSTVEVYDPHTNVWTTAPAISVPRSGLKCVAQGGHIYAIGGVSGWVRQNVVERYDPTSGTWLQVAPMATARSNFGVAVLDNRIFVVGGYTPQGVTAACEVFDVLEDRWYPVPQMMAAKSAMSCVLVDDVAFSQLVLGSGARDEPARLRDPTCERPGYHPAPEEVAPEEPRTPLILDDWSEASSTSADLGDSSN